MSLTDPGEALADQSNFIEYLVGLASLAQIVHELAAAGGRPSGRREPDDFVHVLLGLASVGAAVERLAKQTAAQQNPSQEPSATPTTRWLR